MKFSAIVLRNIKNPFGAVDYKPVLDALLSCGVFLSETVFLPYDDPTAFGEALSRLLAQNGGVCVVCDEKLSASVRSLFEEAGSPFEGDFSIKDGRLVWLLSTGEEGAEQVREGIGTVNRHRNNAYDRVVLRAISVPVETLQSAIAAARKIADGRLQLHVSEKYGDVRIELIYDCETPKMIADEVTRILATSLKGYLYALTDVSIAERLVDTLKLHKLHLSTAESFTGGGVGRAIVKIPGASAVFYEGLNTYDSESKITRLGVSQRVLSDKGAVSEEVARAMAEGLLKEENCSVAIATTGIAGPMSDDSKKPVGLCYLAVGTRERVRVFKFQFPGDRTAVTETAINYALFLAYKEIS